jgi:hypothetical protein
VTDNCKGERDERLVLSYATTSATTYSFVTAGPGYRSWALCTVNDKTGELLITSDWGNWSHRWDASPSALGCATLTDFIGTRGASSYLATKLQGGSEGGRMFSADASAKAMCRFLCERRLEHGRDDYRRRDDYLSAGEARRIWDEVESVARDAEISLDLFIDQLIRIDGFSTYVTEEPWEHIKYIQTPGDRALRDIILPALIEACRTAGPAAESAAATRMVP